MSTTDSGLIGQVHPARPAHAGTTLAWPVRIYLLCVVIPLGVYAGPLYLPLLRAVLLSMMIPLAFYVLSGRIGKPNIADIAFTLHIVWMAIALVAHNSGGLVERVGSTGLEFLGGYFLARIYIRTREQFVSMVWFLAWIVAAMVPIALYEARTGAPIVIEFFTRLPGIVSEQIVTTEGRLGLERVQGVFSGPIHFGTFCASVFMLAFLGLQERSGRMLRIILCTLIALNTFLSLSAGAILALAVQLGLLIWYMMLRRVAKRWIILLALAALAYVVVDILSNRTPIEVFMSYATFSAHNAYWRALIWEWGLRNIFGDVDQGIPSARLFGIGFAQWVRPDFMHTASVDNFWLLMAMRYGVMGFLTVGVGFFGTLLRLGMRDLGQDEGLLRLRRAFIFTFVGLAFTLSTVHVWTALYSYIFFLFGAGMWMLTTPVQTPATVSDGASLGSGDTMAPDQLERRYSRFPVIPRP